MLATLVCEQRIYRLFLPEKISGKYWMTDDENDLSGGRLFSIEAAPNSRSWVIRSQKSITVACEAGFAHRDLLLEERTLYQLKIEGRGRAALFTEPNTADRRVFHKYMVEDGATISIGRKNDNDIIVDDPYVGSHHASLHFQNGVWFIQDHNSANGTYVNKKRSTGQQTLYAGDSVFILGFRCVVGYGFLSVNNPDGQVSINSGKLFRFEQEPIVDREDIVLPANSYYHRSPRFRQEIEELVLKVDMPTKREDQNGQPILLTIGSALIMGAASFSVAIISMINAINEGRSLASTTPTLITASAMLLGMILFPVLIRRREKKEKKEKEKERRQKYLEYLERLKKEIRLCQTQQKDYLLQNHPPIVAQASKPDFFDIHLWEISEGQKDFLSFRIGIGNMPMYANIDFPEDRFTIEDDVMRDELFQFQKEERLLVDVPVTFSLVDNRILGIVGKQKGLFQLLYNLLLQIFLLHSYDEVKLICICREADERRLSFLRYAKHLWDDEGKQRYLAVSEENLRELSILVNRIIAERREKASDNQNRVYMPHYIILSTDKELSNKCDFLQDILSDPLLPGFSVICAYDEIKNLPKECSSVIEVNESQGIMMAGKAGMEGRVSFVQDRVERYDAENLTRQMSAQELDLNIGRYDLPESLAFLEMLGVGKCEHLNILNRWEKNDPVKTLQAAIGVDTLGSVFYLDLHEKFHGPHGLIAGMTGSGKSEFVITYILSMAINYHPDEVGFVLIDYKGGGLAGAFDNENYRLPHLMGTITNLDGDSIMRSILSIKSELRRRQTIFNRARVMANEGTMDIYKYQKMVRDGLAKEPIPHLFIIADEFAELKAQQPEFMDQLISTARIGRSLGVHLILATQKPAGVVNDQIWANSRFKVCLKVQDKADSNDMLKRPEAAELKETGRFYLQVGYNELFEMGQSAWSGAPYTGNETAESILDSNIEILDELGNVVDKLKFAQKADTSSSNAQIVKIMEYLDQLAKTEKLKARRLWLPEMPGIILMDSLLKTYNYKKDASGLLVGVIGEVDDPYQQSKHLLTIDFTNDGNALIYGVVGSGKEMMITAVLYSLYENYGPEELNTYILDFDAESLQIFRNAPQTGGVIMDGDSEEIRSFFGMMQRELRRRKKLFAEHGGDYLHYQLAKKEQVPYVLVVLHNYAHFFENYEQYDDLLISLARECPKYGIFFMLTSSSPSAVRYRLAQSFSQIFVMRLNDKSDYTTLLGRTDGIYPSKYQGRGIIKTDETYVFQTASVTEEKEKQADYLRMFCGILNDRYKGQSAKPIPIVPKFVSGLILALGCQSFERVPAGISFTNYEPILINLRERNVLYVLSQDESLLSAFTGGMIEVVSGITGARIIVLNGSRELKQMSDVNYINITSDFEEKVVDVFNSAVERNNNYKKTDGNPTVDMTPIVLILQEYSKIERSLTEDGKDKLRVLLTKTEGFCNIFFLITDLNSMSNSYSAAEWLSERVNGNGIWLGDGIEDQLRFNVTRRQYGRTEVIDRKTGFMIDHGMASRMRYVMASSLLEEMSNEE